VKAYEAIVKGENIAEPSIPESFKVLLKEMQSLALDVNVVSEEGQRTEMRDEDDDLLRAAEELGIDLSGVRAPAADAPAEETEGEEGREAAAEATDTETAGADESLEVQAEDDEDDPVEELDAEELLGETAAVADAAIATDETPEETP
jgi:DNA-directed RNA polymerase subunit beta